MTQILVRGAVRPGVTSHAAGFWVVAAAFLVSMAFSVVPAPLWLLYQRTDHFSTFMVTVAFAAYAVGVLVSLFLVGHVSDWLGRRSILVPAILLEVVAAVLFLVWYRELAGLIVARFISGLGIGAITSTATAHIFELHTAARPDDGRSRSDAVSTAANMGGFAVGGLVSSILVQAAPHPLTTPYVVFGMLLLAAGLAVALVPETVVRAAEHRPYRPQRLRVPPQARPTYLAAGAVAFAAFSVMGTFTSLAPSFLSTTLHQTSPVLGGAVLFVTFGSSAVMQLAVRSLSTRAASIVGLSALISGLVLVAVSAFTASLPLFVVAGFVGGAGAGIVFKTAVVVGTSLADPQYRGEAVAGVFLAAYLGLVVPVVGIGAATLAVTLATALVAFAAVTVLVALAGGRVLLRH